MAPGTKLVSKHVKYSTTQITGLAVGCYRVKEPEKQSERILIIRDEDKGGENPVVVTELGSDKREIEIGPSKSASNSNSSSSAKSPSSTQKKKKARDDDDFIDDDEDDSDEDDSDDPSWGRKRKKKNDAKGKKRKRSKY